MPQAPWQDDWLVQAGVLQAVCWIGTKPCLLPLPSSFQFTVSEQSASFASA